MSWLAFAFVGTAASFGGGIACLLLGRFVVDLEPALLRRDQERTGLLAP